MPEAKNTFLKAKMNQDLDDRLLPNGEYRTAQNILVGKSEEDSVGTLQNIEGNALISVTSLPDGVYGTKIIMGYYVDKTNQRIITFVTDHKTSATAPNDAYCSIMSYNVLDGTYTALVTGSFLNFSTQNPIISVNIIEDLLFWTDNRNQPRKINVATALSNPLHYYDENHISVAKYNPYKPISLIKEEIETVISVTSTIVFEVAENSGIVEGMTVLGVDSSGSTTILPNEYITVVSAVASATPGQTTVTISDAPTTPVASGHKIYFLASTMTDKSGISTWPGDPDYLEDKFVRFAYRFKFEDNEYSVFSPFTQIAFIPKQKGYFINGQENNAVRSTVLDWFENGINNIDLIIPLPDVGSNLSSSYKIKEIDVLYKESDQIPVKIVDTILASQLTTVSDNFYIYSYQSRKPIRTLPEAQTVRVYDKVPVKAKVQEIISNRVVYGNFQTKHTPPSTIDYNINVQKKLASGEYTNFIEYPNHTIKQNRNYQVGFVLSDKFGRQSDVILSPVKNSTASVGSAQFVGSTAYAEYIQDDPEGSGVVDPSYMPDGVIDWFGNSLTIAVNSPIVSTQGTDGAPGLYAEQKGDGFDLLAGSSTTITDSTYTFELDPSGNTDIPAEDDYMRGALKDYVKVTGVVNTSGNIYEVTTDGRVSELYEVEPLNVPDIKYVYNINTLGWYSYKIVVKQVEQEYYNVYLPSAIAASGWLTDSTDTDAAVSYITLINDNINKVPRDLAEVGPDQKQYRSSVRLFGRVKPTVDTTGGAGNYVYGNTQFYPINKSDISTAVGDTDNLLGASLADTDPIFQYDSGPIVARVSTSDQFGINYADFTDTPLSTERFQLAVYETEPVVSNLDIYWETAEAGLISDLNWDVNVGYDGPVGFEDRNFSFEESDPANTPLTQDFYPLDRIGSQLTNTTLGGYTVTNGLGVDVTTDFLIAQRGTGEYYVENVIPFTYLYDSYTRDVFTFEITINPPVGASWTATTLSFSGSLTNNTPSFTSPSPPYYYFDDTYTAGQVIHDFSTNSPSNGAFSNTTAGLKWEITAGNSAGYFAMNQTTGELTLTATGESSAGFGTYPLDIKLTDATSGGALDAGSLSVTQSYSIIKGYPMTNLGYDSDTRALEILSGSDGFFTYGNEREFVYYIAGSSLTPAQLPSLSGTANTGPRYNRLGSGALERGEFIFGIENAYITSYLGSFNTSVLVQFEAYYRPDSSSSWSTVGSSDGYDLNDRNFYNAISPYNGGFSNTGASAPAYNHNLFYAQNKPGEYCFIIRIFNNQAGNPATTINFSARLRDLHYTSITQSQEVYKYNLYENGGAGWSAANSVDTIAPIEAVYSDQPFGEYNRRYFTDSNLANIYTPPTANKYYLVELNSSFDPSRAATDTRLTAGGTASAIGAAPIIKANGEIDTTSATNDVQTVQDYTTTWGTVEPWWRGDGDYFSFP